MAACFKAADRDRQRLAPVADGVINRLSCLAMPRHCKTASAGTCRSLNPPDDSLFYCFPKPKPTDPSSPFVVGPTCNASITS